jgi:hypothetical protein
LGTVGAIIDGVQKLSTVMYERNDELRAIDAAVACTTSRAGSGTPLDTTNVVEFDQTQVKSL